MRFVLGRKHAAAAAAVLPRGDEAAVHGPSGPSSRIGPGGPVG